MLPAVTPEAKIQAKRREIPDGNVRGLYHVHQPSGAESWALRYRNKAGVTRKLTLGGDLSRTETRKEIYWISFPLMLRTRDRDIVKSPFNNGPSLV